MMMNEIDPLNLPYVFLTDKAKLPEVSGVYFAIAPSSRIVYIGSSANLYKRWDRQHNRIKDLQDYRYIKIAWLEVKQGWLTLESRLINKFNPVLNIRGRHFMPDEDEDYQDTLVHLNRHFISGLIDGIVNDDIEDIAIAMEIGLL